MGIRFDNVFQQKMFAEYRGQLMGVKTFIVVALLFISLIVVMNRFSNQGKEKKGYAWILAVVVAAGCLWYIGK